MQSAVSRATNILTSGCVRFVFADESDAMLWGVRGMMQMRLRDSDLTQEHRPAFPVPSSRARIMTAVRHPVP